MIFHPSRVESEVLHTYLGQAFVEVTLLPACHREDVRLLALLHAQVLSAHEMERRQRGVDMQISGGGGACLTIEEPGALFAVAAEKRDLETCGVEVHKPTTIQIRISRGQHDEPRLGRVFLVEKDHDTQATLQRLVPYDGGIQVEMQLICAWAEVLETAQVLEVDLPVILPPCPTALWVRTGVEKEAVGVAPQFGAGVQLEAEDCINIFLLRLVTIYTMIGDARRQAMPMRT